MKYTPINSIDRFTLEHYRKKYRQHIGRFNRSPPHDIWLMTRIGDLNAYYFILNRIFKMKNKIYAYIIQKVFSIWQVMNSILMLMTFKVRFILIFDERTIVLWLMKIDGSSVTLQSETQNGVDWIRNRDDFVNER